MSNEQFQFDDPTVARKLTVQICRAGFGIHPDRGLLYVPLDDQSTCPEDLLKYVKARAEIQYEIDIVLATSGDTIDETQITSADDNIYLLSNINEEQDLFLQHVSKVTLSPESFRQTDETELTPKIEEAFKLENWKRDETTKQAVFRVGFTMQKNQKR